MATESSDDEDVTDQLPLIRLESENDQVILRNRSSVVLYNPRSRQVQLVDAPPAETEGICPTCQRPFEQQSPDTEWMSPDYFRLLNRSRRGSVNSRSPSPQHLLPESPTTSTGPPRRGRYLEGNEPPPKHHKISSAAFSPNYFAQHFVEVRTLGRGGSGVVLQVRHVLDGHSLGDLACKRIPVGDDVSWLTKVLSEVQLLQKLRHPNLVAYMHVWLEHFQPSTFAPSIPHAFILQQYCNEGDLHDYIVASYQSKSMNVKNGDSATVPHVDATGHIPFDQVRAFFKDITSGLKYLHSNGFVHRDLKPSNCLLHRTDKRLIVLVSDFGETTEESASRKSSGNTGTISYCAPETLSRDPVTGLFGNFTQKSDIFSLGLIVHFMCFGRLPFTNANPLDEQSEDYDKIRAEISAWRGLHEHSDRFDLSDRMMEDLSRLLSQFPDDRPSSDEILRALKAGSGIYDHIAKGTTTRNSVIMDDEDDRPSSPVKLAQTTASSGKLPAPRYGRRESFQSDAKGMLIRRRKPESLRRPAVPTPSPRLLLPAPPNRSIITRLFTGKVFVVARALVFGLKVWTTITPCLPFATRRWTALFLVGIAAMDLVGLGAWVSILLASFHVVALASLRSLDVMCETV